MRDEILSPYVLYDAREKEARVRRLQRMLRIISAAEGDPALNTAENGDFDETTRAAVRAFQRKAGLSVSGEADLPTWERIRKAAECHIAAQSRPAAIRPFPDCARRIEAGEYSDLVLIVQIMLNALRLYYDDIAALPLSGRWDESAAEALRAFQRIHRLEETGTLDRAVWEELSSAYNRIAGENQ